jgi:uncharacterized protein (TIGR02466 family)|tara:strand:- start:451 stop:1185 length:735 start_codon:yes stop_codon:yes gene_type:complete
MEIDNVQVVKPFGPLIMLAQLPEGVIKKLNEVVDVIKDKKDMGARLAGVIETESEIPHSMLEEKKVMNIFHALSRSYIEQAYLNAGLQDQWNAMDVKTQMQSIWSVSQYENEYNPQHNHSHCQISAVLYLKIPAMKPRNIPNKPREKDGQIEFTFCTNESIFTTGSFVARPKPGMCLLFPNTLYHQVYPFQGSGERRSIAFNMAFKGFSKSSGIQLAGDSVNLYNETNHADTIPWRVIEQGYHK